MASAPGGPAISTAIGRVFDMAGTTFLALLAPPLLVALTAGSQSWRAGVITLEFSRPMETHYRSQTFNASAVATVIFTALLGIIHVAASFTESEIFYSTFHRAVPGAVGFTLAMLRIACHLVADQQRAYHMYSWAWALHTWVFGLAAVVSFTIHGFSPPCSSMLGVPLAAVSVWIHLLPLPPLHRFVHRGGAIACIAQAALLPQRPLDAHGLGILLTSMLTGELLGHPAALLLASQ